MKAIIAASAALLIANAAPAADEPDSSGIPIEKIIDSVSHKINRKFLT